MLAATLVALSDDFLTVFCEVVGIGESMMFF
jgi:hypothetical protein